MKKLKIVPRVLPAVALAIWIIPGALVTPLAPNDRDVSSAEIKFADMGAADAHDIVARPPFRPDRRPVQPHAKGPNERHIDVVTNRGAIAPSAMTGLALVGTMIGSGGGVALIRSAQTGQVQSYSNGQTIGAWTIEAIAIDHVTLHLGSSEVELRFHATEEIQQNSNRVSQVNMQNMIPFMMNLQK